MLVAAAFLLCGVAAQSEVPVDDDDAELPGAPPAADPADAQLVDTSALRSKRGKQIVITRVDGSVVTGGVLDVDGDAVVIVDAKGRRITLNAMSVRSWREVPVAHVARPAPDVRPSAGPIATGAGVCGALGCALGALGTYGFLASSSFDAAAVVLVAAPALSAATGASIGFMMSDDELVPSPTIVIVAAAAGGGAVLGGGLGALAGAATGTPVVFAGGAFVGAGAGAALASHLTSTWMGFARE